MRFSSLPRGTVTTIIFAILLIIIWVIWGSLKYPEALWAPGNLSRYHSDTSSCNDCHQPFQGATVSKCINCHSEKQFSKHAKPTVSEFHRKTISEGRPCTECHTEHRGALAQITIGAMKNPHGEFIFRATGTRSCTACHDFGTGLEKHTQLLDNFIVSHLMKEGEGSHRPGKMANCLRCHKGGRLDFEEDD
jgi:Doubled CXXCH motif (Paired_CXXCH_1)